MPLSTITSQQLICGGLVYIFFSLNFIMFCHQPFFRKIIDTSLECCIDQKKSRKKWDKLLEILFTYNKFTTVFQKYP